MTSPLDQMFGLAPDVLAQNTSSALLAAVCDRLRAKVPALGVEEFPDDPENYQLKHQVGAYLVRYVGAKYSAGEVDSSVQLRRLLVDVVVIARKLNGPSGTTVWIEAARLALAGFEPAGFDRLVPTQERFEGRGQNQWVYAIQFAAPTLAVELSDDESGAEINALIFANERDTTEVSNDG